MGSGDGERGWRSGESTRLLPMWPGFDSRTRRHMWVEFVVGSRPRSEGFSPGSPVFLPPQKSTLLNSNSIGNSGRRATLWKCHCKFPFIYYFIILFKYDLYKILLGRFWGRSAILQYGVRAVSIIHQILLIQIRKGQN